MTSYGQLNTIKESGKSLFTTEDLRQLLEITKDRTLEDLIKRLIDQEILVQMEKGKYLLKGAHTSDFEIAQFLYSPSYISFETALNYHGILSQFPVEITSATTKSTTQKQILEKTYVYSKLSITLYTGYYKENNTLIAYPEKALLDHLYMISKGIKTEQYLDEMDYTNLDRTKIKKYVSLVPQKLQTKIAELIETYL